MRIFFLAQRVPYPPNRGDKITTYHEIKHLAQSHDVHVFCLSEGPADQENIRALERIVSRVHAVSLGRFRARLRALLAVPSRKPLTLAYFGEARLRRLVEREFRNGPPDLIFVYSSSMAQFVEDLPLERKIMQFGDIDSLKWRNFATRSRPPMKWVYTMEANRLLAYERRVARAFSHSLLYTDAELKDFLRLVHDRNVSLVKNGVDLEYFRPNGTKKKKHTIIFTGVMDYYPNVDAVIWFQSAVLPLIRKEIDDAHLVVCGARPTREVIRLARDPAVTVTGWVEETLPFMQEAEVAIAPLRLGRGIQNKVLEAMATGLPCVATSIAFEGVTAEPGRDILVADEPRQIADHVVRLLSDDAMRRQVAENARQAMERHYTWNKELSELDRVIDRVMAAP